MKSWRRIQSFGIAVCLVAACGCARRPSEDMLARCREVGSGELQSPGLAVFAGSRLDETGAWHGGRVPSCTADRSAVAAFLAARDALDSVPGHLRPAQLTLQYRPTVPGRLAASTALELHAPTGNLLATTREVGRLDRSVWLHEIAHAAMLGERPQSWHARRLARALEEGVADYFAAAISRNPRIGDAALGRRGLRDLLHPPTMTALHWAALGLHQAPFDPHEYGWAFAALLWREEPRVGQLLPDLIQCFAEPRHLARAGAQPAGVFDAMLRDCPGRSRLRIETILRLWVPEPLQPAVGPDAFVASSEGTHS